ncbi:hypothetical protein BKA64DRAFT_740550 [Cadophora sp. MPI-SDFR-AT-0126]|nr:hypothetical protein BKA64DRAFT_740550 [Leotiomycetes sp. MPI-SDFR-AT-0126]
MNRRRFNFILLGWMITTTVTGRNDFNPAFPTTFSFNEMTPFFWLDSRDSDLISIFVMGDTHQFERLQLPLDPQSCLRRSVVDTVTTCTAWENNGTATFGGNYAAILEAGRLYHMVINYEVQDEGSKGSSQSEVFRMINPLPSTGTRSSSSTSSVIQSSAISSSQSQSQSQSSTPSTSQITNPGSSSTTTTLTSTSTSASTSTSVASTTGSPYPTSSSTPQNGLTPGAKGGITVGVLALIILIFFAALFFHRKRQAKKKAQADQQRDQEVNRSTAVNLEDIDITLGSPVTYDRVYEGRRGWHQRSLPPIFLPGRTTNRAQSQRELHGSPF